MDNITLKYDQGIKKEEVVQLEIPKQAFEEMLENDYQYRLANATDGEIIERRTAQEFFDEMNRKERNSWQTHTRHQHQYPIKLAIEEDESIETSTMDFFSDHSQLEMLEANADYEAICQVIRNSPLKPDQAEMIISICIDGMSVNDYAKYKNENPKNISKKFMRIKNNLREILCPKNLGQFGQSEQECQKN